MRVDVRRRGVEIDSGEQSYLERRLAFALGRFGPRVVQVSVFLTDENGPKGGLDKRCRLVARLSQLGVITVDDRDAELTPLVDRSTDRLERAIERAIERRHASASRRCGAERSSKDERTDRFSAAAAAGKSRLDAKRRRKEK